MAVFRSGKQLGQWVWQRIRPIPWYPLLLSWYPILFYFQHNQRELDIDDIWLPLLLSSVLTVGVLVVMRGIWRSWSKAAVFTTVLLAIFFTHGQFRQLMGGFTVHLWKLPLDANKLLMIGWVVVLLLAIWLLWRRWRGDYLVFQKALGGLSVVLVGMALLLIGVTWVQEGGKNAQVSARPVPSPTTTQIATSSANKPDVYYFIFDRYGGAQTIEDDYGYQAEKDFLQQLQQLGFYVASDSHTNYPKTAFSIASSLNMNYLDQLIHVSSPSAPESKTVDTLYDNHQVGQFMEQQGYTYYNVGSWFDQTRKINEANVNVSPGPEDFLQNSDFNTQFLNTTIYPSLLQLVGKGNGNAAYIDQHRGWAEFQYRALPGVIDKSGPKFVFAHVLQPHPPYVFDQNCEPITKDISGPEAIPYYVNQLQCTNQHILQLMKQILTDSKTPPIIVLQADEGPQAMKNTLPTDYTFKNADLAAIQERTRILNAYYLPGQHPAVLTSTITPVNTFRMIFDTYFGANYPILPNKTYVFQDDKHLFNLTDVSSEVGEK